MRSWSRGAVAAFGAALLLPLPASAHCDGLDGPVVGAARKALDAGDPNLVLIWVQPRDEVEVSRAFAEAAAVRKLGPQARDLADRYFLETLVRVHRAGEGAPYTGLKPAGRDLGPAIPLADKAIASGSDRKLVEFIGERAEQGVRERFAELQGKRIFRSDDLAAGRGYVASYVKFIHYVEGLYDATKSAAAGHFEDGQPTAAEHHE
jgi:hypothetical protein